MKILGYITKFYYRFTEILNSKVPEQETMLYLLTFFGLTFEEFLNHYNSIFALKTLAMLPYQFVLQVQLTKFDVHSDLVLGSRSHPTMCRYIPKSYTLNCKSTPFSSPFSKTYIRLLYLCNMRGNCKLQFIYNFRLYISLGKFKGNN